MGLSEEIMAGKKQKSGRIKTLESHPCHKFLVWILGLDFNNSQFQLRGLYDDLAAHFLFHGFFKREVGNHGILDTGPGKVTYGNLIG